jgi:ubiquinone/menaquinone biosynthesis C-methylase UbiE
MAAQRFSGTVGAEYRIFPEAVPHYFAVERTVASSVKIRRASRFSALEIGAGTGFTASAFAERFQKAEITTLDSEPVMLRQAKRNLAGYGGRIRFVNDDALAYLKTLRRGTLDVVFSSATIHNFDSAYRHRVLQNICRVLKPGGVFVNGDKYANDDLEERYRVFNLGVARLISIFAKKNRNQKLAYDWIVHYGEDEHQGKIMVESLAKEEMARLGFTQIRTVYRKEMDAVICAKGGGE